jgi:hypothetical protein
MEIFRQNEAARGEAEVKELCEQTPDAPGCPGFQPGQPGGGGGNCEPICQSEGGGGTDPYEVLTGEQALSLASRFNSESLRYSGYATICGKANNITCQTEDELTAQIYGEGAENSKPATAGYTMDETIRTMNSKMEYVGSIGNTQMVVIRPTSA